MHLLIVPRQDRWRSVVLTHSLLVHLLPHLAQLGQRWASSARERNGQSLRLNFTLHTHRLGFLSVLGLERGKLSLKLDNLRRRTAATAQQGLSCNTSGERDRERV